MREALALARRVMRCLPGAGRCGSQRRLDKGPVCREVQTPGRRAGPRV